MKNRFERMIWCFTLIFLMGFNAFAQQLPALPIDPKVKYGKLENGLTYYIRHNQLPKQRAEFYIAQRVGSILEEESQRGLAHFLEHMAFNGTKNFKDKAMLNYLETIGVKFGENVNAYTSFDETVYNISSVPVIRDGIVDSCLLILHDWSSSISLDNKEIDKERGVIHEEWRTRNNAQARIWEQLIPQIYVGSQYANRMPIGLMSVVDNFKYQALKDYYKKWYRPDLQAIIVVGDLDVNQVEAKIKKIFSDIPKPINPAKRIFYPVPDNDQPIIAIANDPEATNISLNIFFKHDGLPDEAKPTMLGLIDNYLKGLAESMLNDRLRELTQKANPPFVAAEVGNDVFMVSQTKEAYTASAMCKTGEIENAMKVLLQEVYRVGKHGFTVTELERAKANMLRSIESAYNEREKQKNGSYVHEYIQHFTVGEPIPGIEFEYNFASQFFPQISLEKINKDMQKLINEKNVVITLSGPQKEGIIYPTKENLLSIFNEVKSAQLTPYQDNVSNEPLVSKPLKAGRIKKESLDNLFDAKVFTLSNGAKVVVKTTNFKQDQILMKAVSLGGTSLLDNKEIANIFTLNDVISINGLGNYSKTDLPKVLAGKKVGVNASIGTTTEALSGSCSPKDLSTLMQLIYLSFTSPKADKEAFASYLSRSKSILDNNEANPMNALRDTLYHTMYGDHPRAKRMKSNMLNQVNYDRIIQIYKERFANAADFTFFFVGNINIDSLKPMLETYIASLPSNGKKEVYADIKMNKRTGDIKNLFEKKLETPKITAYNVYSGNCPYSLENILKMSLLDQILDIIFTEKIREDEGGTYGVRVSGSVMNYPKNKFQLLIGFDTNEAQRDKLLSIVNDELKTMVDKGPSEINFNKVKEFMLKKHKENLIENGYWLNTLSDYYLEGFNRESSYVELLNGLTPSKIKDFAGRLLSQGNRIQVIMNGVKK